MKVTHLIKVLFFIAVFLLFIINVNNFRLEGTKLIKASETIIKSEMMSADDIPEWDIELNCVEKVEIRRNTKDAISYQLEYEEIESLITAFNSIKKSDIYWDLSSSENLYGYMYAFINIKMIGGEEIHLPYTPFGIISYQNFHYYTNFQLPYYDVIRCIDEKYNIRILDLENEFLYEYSNNGFAVACYENLICSPNKTINEARKAVGMQVVNDGEKKFAELLDLYKKELELNDVIETDDMLIKVIEIKENQRVTAIAVQFKGFGMG